MSRIQSSSFLRRVVAADAISCAGMGLLLFLLSDTLAALFALPAGLLAQAGLVLLPCAAFMAFVASRSSISRVAVWIVIVGNIVWVAESLLLLGLDSIEANALGHAFVIAQALFVAGITALEYAGLRRSVVLAA